MDMTEDSQSRNVTTDTRYPREQDLGRTELGDVGEVHKADIRVEAFADCEAANAAIGHALCLGGYSVEEARLLTSLQNDLFDLAADLSAPLGQDLDPEPVRITDAHVTWVQRAHEHYRTDLTPVDGFVLPGGTLAASLLFQARIAVRRAERTILRAMDEHPGAINPLSPTYLNSVSSLLFALARSHNAEHGDTVWRPLASVTPPVEEPSTASATG
jgi:cob(I)alamin adenosyltransferase